MRDHLAAVSSPFPVLWRPLLVLVAIVKSCASQAAFAIAITANNECFAATVDTATAIADAIAVATAVAGSVTSILTAGGLSILQ